MTSEQEAREKIDDLLRQCGRDVQDCLLESALEQFATIAEDLKK